MQRVAVTKFGMSNSSGSDTGCLRMDTARAWEQRDLDNVDNC